jgi:hypothetical protein
MSDLGLASLKDIRDNLDRIFGEGLWENLETETISLTLDVVLDPLARDKISLLRVLAHDPDLFFEDPMVFLHGVEVINNNVADFDFLPVPSTLEAIYAIDQVNELIDEPVKVSDFSLGVKKTLANILVQDGFSHIPSQLSGVPLGWITNFPETQDKTDVSNRDLAIKAYSKHMMDEQK